MRGGYDLPVLRFGGDSCEELSTLGNYSLDPSIRSANISKHVFGALAQLGERMAGSHEVRGSIPLCSTKFSTAFWRSFLYKEGQELSS